MELVYSPRICHVVANINEHTGGSGVAVSDLAASLVKQDVISHLLTLDYQQLGAQYIPLGTKLHSYPANLLTQLMRGQHPGAFRALGELASTDLDLIHNHGLWMFPNYYARKTAMKHSLPLVISPHGMLEDWSLKRSRLKKWLAWSLYEKKNLSSAIVFHATSAAESNSIRRLGLQQAIALIPIGINADKYQQEHNREVLTNLFPVLSDRRWLLFMSRLHPKKGIDNLLLAWQQLENKFPDWHLVLAGPDLVGYQSKLETLVEQLNLRQRVTFTGMLTGKYKAAALCNADLFILPTHSENFGIVIAESLASGVPVITTKGTPWKDLNSYQCGWWIENQLDALTATLSEGMSLPLQQRRAMGLRGRDLIQNKYSWESASRQMAAVYRWVLNGGTPPDCVQFAVSNRSVGK